jgi:hypothetical protein
MTSNIQPRLRQCSRALATCVGKSTGGLAHPKVRHATVTSTYAYLGPTRGAYMGERTVLPSTYGVIYIYIYLIYIYIYLLTYCGPPADGGHPGGRRTGGRADTPAGSGRGGGALYYGWAYMLTL